MARGHCPTSGGSSRGRRPHGEEGQGVLELALVLPLLLAFVSAAIDGSYYGEHRSI